MVFRIVSNKDYEVGKVINLKAAMGPDEQCRVLSKVPKDEGFMYELEFVVE